jgi:hypothetical protein
VTASASRRYGQTLTEELCRYGVDLVCACVSSYHLIADSPEFHVTAIVHMKIVAVVGVVDRTPFFPRGPAEPIP